MHNRETLHQVKFYTEMIKHEPVLETRLIFPAFSPRNCIFFSIILTNVVKDVKIIIFPVKGECFHGTQDGDRCIDARSIRLH